MGNFFKYNGDLFRSELVASVTSGECFNKGIQQWYVSIHIKDAEELSAIFNTEKEALEYVDYLEKTL